MSNRKGTPPDIMASLMGAVVEQESNKTIKPAINKEIKQEESDLGFSLSNANLVKTPVSNEDVIRERAIKQVNNKEIKPESNKAIIEDQKEKATFNLSINTLEALEESWLMLRKKVKDHRITKTLIVEKAIEMALSEFERYQEKSTLFKKLLQ